MCSVMPIPPAIEVEMVSSSMPKVKGAGILGKFTFALVSFPVVRLVNKQLLEESGNPLHIST